MRILFTIHHELDPGAGAPGVTLRIAQALAARGHDTQVFSWDDLPARLGPRARELTFPAFASRQIAAQARRGLDVADCSTADAWPYLLRPRRPARPLVVTRTHGLEHRYREARWAQARSGGDAPALAERVYHDGVRLREVETTLRRADLVLFLNTVDRDRAVRELHVRADRAELVANGVDDLFLGLPLPEPAAAGPLRLAQVGSWDARKGTATTVAALGALARQGVRPELAILGARVAPPDVLAAFDPDVRGQVTVVERYDPSELPALLRGRHVLLLPSLAEGFSLALLEGMAAGLAPVASDVGAAADLLGGERGIVVPPADPRALAGAIAALDEDRPRLERLRVAAHAVAQEHSWAAIAEQTERLYADAIAARGAR